MLNRKTMYALGVLALLVPALIVFTRQKPEPQTAPVKLRFPRSSSLYGHEDLKTPFVTKGLAEILAAHLPEFKGYEAIIDSVKLDYFPQLFPAYFHAELSGCYRHPVTGHEIPGMSVIDENYWPEFTIVDLPWNY